MMQDEWDGKIKKEFVGNCRKRFSYKKMKTTRKRIRAKGIKE